MKKKYYLMSDDYSCAFHDVLEYLNASNLNPIEKRKVEDEIYAMMQENDARHVPITTLFPQGLEPFCDEFVTYISRKTWWQILLKGISFFFIGVLVVAFAEYVISFSDDGNLIPPKVFFFRIYDALHIIVMAILWYFYFNIWQKYILKKGAEGDRRKWFYVIPIGILLFLWKTNYIDLLMSEDNIEIHLPYLPVVFIAIAAVVIIHKVLHYCYQSSFKKYAYNDKEDEML